MPSKYFDVEMYCSQEHIVFCFFEKYILCVKRKTLTRHDLLLYCNLFISLKIYVSADLDSSNQKNIGRTKQECYNLFNEKIKQWDIGSKTKIIDLEATFHGMRILIVAFDNRFQKEKTSAIKVEAIMIFLINIFHMSSIYYFWEMAVPNPVFWYNRKKDWTGE